MRVRALPGEVGGAAEGGRTNASFSVGGASYDLLSLEAQKQGVMLNPDGRVQFAVAGDGLVDTGIRMTPGRR